jgi:DNA-directed RNA polymerase beta subunit
MPWEGYNFEDTKFINEHLYMKIFTLKLELAQLEKTVII